MRTLRRLFLSLLLLPALSLHAACDSLPSSTGAPVDFKAVQAIFNKRCTSCHTGAAAPEGLQLTEFRSYSQLVDTPSNEVPTLKRVKPGSASSSYLFQKINCDTPKSGSRMPAFDKLTLEEQATIRDWINQGALSANEDPTLDSAPTATPKNTIAGAPVAFAAAASDASDDPLSFLWNFGDGVTRTGASVTHAYLTAGIYTASVTASDDRGGSVTASVIVTVEMGPDFDADGTPDGLDPDDDNDGVPDAIELAIGTSPNDATVPTGAGAATPMTVSSFTTKLDFTRELNDKLSLKGSFSVSGNAPQSAQQVVIVAGDLVRSFQITDKGSSAPDPAAQFKLKLGKPDSSSLRLGKFSVKLSQSALAAALLNEELESAVAGTSGEQLTRILIYAEKTVFQADVTLLFTRKMSRSASLNLKKK